jgi:CRP-like cAMP-binding protein
MSNPDRPDSATALARSPLFSHLGRLDLARLAGELEEMHFAPGHAIVRQGDWPDGFYVIKHGRATVLAGTTSTPAAGDGTGGEEPLTTLGPGEVFGEMALLTDSPRTATVVAETDLTVWRLSRPRFDTLLDHERGIARSIERSLSHRLAAMNQETGALRAFSHRLTAAALGRLSPGSARLVYFASEGDLFTHAQARWPLVLESLLRPVALLLSAGLAAHGADVRLRSIPMEVLA